ncbi:hypothetical protein [Porcincola intestinalis]|uniref:hypothetical protein n=1 Tax=Porcincola intestinalis TaxID=2606632 RepID=UPI0023F34212|nr:hypothetical protein [Porcincola intestinalis]MCI6766399.1 hypothetical protein [Lachnospiraceae bacterium]MDD7059517.1 hypothetical protein [Porcincola intestinalis]MDY5283765.1 hypothetical protein [Porcincola intestinalis]
MKKLILRVNDLNLFEEGRRSLIHASFNLFEGEVTALLGLAASGKQLVIDLMTAERIFLLPPNVFYIYGNAIETTTQLRKYIYIMAPQNYKVKDWTVADFIGLDEMKGILSARKLHRKKEELTAYVQGLHISLDLNARMEDLNEVDKRIVDVIRALRSGKKVLLLEREFDGMDMDSVRLLAVTIKKLIQGRMAAVVFCDSEKISAIMADEFLIFRRGQIVRKCNAASADMKILDQYFLGYTIGRKKRELEASMTSMKAFSIQKTAYRLSNMNISIEGKREISFMKGEIIAFISSELGTMMRLFYLLSGRVISPETSYDMGEGYMHPRSHEDFLRHRIIAAEKPGDSPEDGTFESLSASANMLFPLIGKMSFGSYLLNHNGIQNYVCNELSMEDIQAEKKMSELDQRSRIIVLMKRWLIYKPQVFILRAPFSKCDSYNAIIIESFLKKMAAEGSAIILLVSQPEYIEDIADKMIRVDSEL